MDRATIVVVGDDPGSLGELQRRYVGDYEVVSERAADSALLRLEQFRDAGVDVALVLADQWLPRGATGVELLCRARDLHPAARRGLLIAWGDRATAQPILEAASMGWMDCYLPKPAWSPDEQFHRTVVEQLDEWWRGRAERYEAVTVIGEDPSARSHELRDLLLRNNVPYGFHARDSDAGREALARLGVAGGTRPVVALFDGTVLVDPTNADVAAALGVDIRPSDRTYDVAIVGAGPAGLAAAVYGASEGLSTAFLEREAFGGQAGTSSLIRNYLGFPRGVSGVELAGRAYEQAWLFGAQMVYGNEATALRASDGVRRLELADGSKVRARAVVIATGVSYRQLGVTSLEALVGAGVFYGAGTVEAQALRGRPAVVVGGGNSAGQAAAHLAKYASHVTVVVRSDSLAASMSEYLIRLIRTARNVDVRFRVEVVGGGGSGRLEHVELRDRTTGKVERTAAAGLFVLIGAAPHTDWLEGAVERDEWGYVITGTEGRALLETTMSGVFAVGDVRAGSVKRVASAVGEGSIAVRLVHDYLAGNS